MDYHKPIKPVKYLIFLDVDGVFTSPRVQYASANPKDVWNKFDPIAIDFLNKIHDRVDSVYFVLISTWKDHLKTDDVMMEHWITSSFRNAGFRGEFFSPWKTNPDNIYRRGETRAHEIREYLETYAVSVKDYIIFDDNDYDFDRVLLKKRWVRTDPDDGFLFKHMKNAMSIVGTWESKDGT
jgi:hypothetical protein